MTLQKTCERAKIPFSDQLILGRDYNFLAAAKESDKRLEHRHVTNSTLCPVERLLLINSSFYVGTGL